MINIYFFTLGCPKNQVDSEYMLGILLENKNYREVEQAKDADVIVINTCGFIKEAKEEAIETILEATIFKKRGSCRALIVTGCLTQRYKNEIMDGIPEIDAVLGTGKLDKLDSTINNVLAGEKIKLVDESKFEYKNKPRRVKTGHYAYLKIAEGCNNNCTYCSIPSIRGELKSRPLEEILAEAKNLIQQNVKELILVAQDTTRYGIDLYGQPKLVTLLKKLAKIDNLLWLRILYSYPEHVSDELIKIIKNEDKICSYLDLPIQHSENNIRNKMKREGSRENILNTIKTIRENIPDISLRTSIIVGFPGETEEDFNNLLKFIRLVKFNRLGAFKYSPEENTVAASMKNQIPEEIKEKRYNILMETQKSIARKNNQKLIGNTFEVVIDECYNDYAVGRTEYDAPEIDNQVIIKNPEKLKSGELITCKITGFSEYDLIGEKPNDFK